MAARELSLQSREDRADLALARGPDAARAAISSSRESERD
jgi:hypothetical protein